MLAVMKAIEAIPILDSITTLRCDLVKMTEVAVYHENIEKSLNQLRKVRTIEVISPFWIMLLPGYIIC